MSNINRALAIVKAYEESDVKTFDMLVSDRFVSHWSSRQETKAMVLKSLTANHTTREQKIKAHQPVEKLEVVRKIEENNFVVLHMRLVNELAHKNLIMFEVMRFEHEKLVESWIGMSPEVAKTASGHSQFDGETKKTDHEKTTANKQVVSDFVAKVLAKGETKQATKYVSATKYIQHNPQVKDGLEEMMKAFAELEHHGMKIAYTKTHHIIGDGNFVFTLSDGLLGKDEFKYYDLFRLEKGQIIEHWDVMTPVKSPKI